ncbi:MAG: ABC transporter substrate-binding protein [Gammaproteobacteria bacterium]|nr:ABC transporter substrate-binding protein [Gammaproteobacteria bacterium]MCP5417125.1 ABC transporter substrate-binding protein [Chromatiaceae bacterium]
MSSMLTVTNGRRFNYPRWLLLLLTLISLHFSVAMADEAGPEQIIQQISERLRTVFNSDPEHFQGDPAQLARLANEVLVPHIDFAKVSSLVLGKYWLQATPDQREAFRKQFQQLLVRTYSTAFSELKSWEIRFLPTRNSSGGSDVAVRTHLLLPQTAPIEVLYQMHLKEGSWMAYDVKIDGISLVTNYRTSFGREVKNIGMDGLIRKITQLNEARMQDQEIKNS